MEGPTFKEKLQAFCEKADAFGEARREYDIAWSRLYDNPHDESLKNAAEKARVRQEKASQEMQAAFMEVPTDRTV